MKARLQSLLALLLLLLPFGAGAQDLSSSGFGLEGARDSAAVQNLRAYMDEIRVREARPTVALVLSGGGAKGAAHVGVLRYMESLDIPVDVIFGTSMGGLIGGLYALGYTPAQLDTLLRGADWSLLLSDKLDRKYITYADAQYKRQYLLSFPFYYTANQLQQQASLSDEGPDPTKRLDLSSNGPEQGSALRRNVLNSLPSGFVTGYNVTNMISSLSVGYHADDLDFTKDLPIPFLCVATDVVSAKAKVWYEGDLVTAMRSTMSIPGLFKPVRTGGHILVDGGMRNNYPTDLARQIGADIVIGVELSDAVKGAEEIYNIGDILYKGIDMLSNDSFERNQHGADVTIKPDLHEYDMLSFDPVSIDSIMARGYVAALGQGDSLAMIKRRVGPEHGLTLRSKSALDLSARAVVIDTITVKGVSRHDANYIIHRVEYLKGRHCDKAIIEDAISFIYRTKAFEYVSYELLGTEEPYELQIRCRKGPVNRIGFGGRVDSEELVTALFNVGIGVNKLSGQKLDISTAIGANPEVSVLYSYDAPSLPTLNFKTDYQVRTRAPLYIDADPYSLSNWRWTQQFYISNLSWSSIDLNLGLRNELMRARRLTPDGEAPVPFELDNRLDDNVVAFFRFRIDTFDKNYFPKTGYTLGFDFEHVLTVSDGSLPNFSTFSIFWEEVFSMGSRWAMTPSIRARVLLGDEFPLLYRNYFGGAFAARYLDQQMPFAGIGNMALCGNYLGIVRTDLRYRFAGEHYITSAANLSYDFAQPDDIAHGDITYGFNLGYAYDSFVGPLKADLMWNSRTRSLGFYLSLGYEF